MFLPGGSNSSKSPCLGRDAINFIVNIHFHCTTSSNMSMRQILAQSKMEEEARIAAASAPVKVVKAESNLPSKSSVGRSFFFSPPSLPLPTPWLLLLCSFQEALVHRGEHGTHGVYRTSASSVPCSPLCTNEHLGGEVTSPLFSTLSFRPFVLSSKAFLEAQISTLSDTHIAVHQRQHTFNSVTTTVLKHCSPCISHFKLMLYLCVLRARDGMDHPASCTAHSG